jgi:hypothetical protein
LKVALDGVHGDDEVVGLPVRLDVLQTDESLTLLGFPDDRTEILELLVGNVGHPYESLTVKIKIRSTLEKWVLSNVKEKYCYLTRDLKSIKFIIPTLLIKFYPEKI